MTAGSAAPSTTSSCRLASPPRTPAMSSWWPPVGRSCRTPPRPSAVASSRSTKPRWWRTTRRPATRPRSPTSHATRPCRNCGERSAATRSAMRVRVVGWSRVGRSMVGRSMVGRSMVGRSMVGRSTSPRRRRRCRPNRPVGSRARPSDGRAPGRSCRCTTTRDGRFQLRYSAPAPSAPWSSRRSRRPRTRCSCAPGAGQLVGVVPAEHRCWRVSARDGDRGHRSPTYADALAEMAHRSLSTVTSTGRASHYRVYLHLSTDGAWVNGGGAIPATTARPLRLRRRRPARLGDRGPTGQRRPRHADPAGPVPAADRGPRPRLPVPRLHRHPVRRDPPPARAGPPAARPTTTTRSASAPSTTTPSTAATSPSPATPPDPTAWSWSTATATDSDHPGHTSWPRLATAVTTMRTRGSPPTGPGQPAMVASRSASPRPTGHRRASGSSGPTSSSPRTVNSPISARP